MQSFFEQYYQPTQNVKDFLNVFKREIDKPSETVARLTMLRDRQTNIVRQNEGENETLL